jgi:NADPH:quinone reductase-like Zn-dependent oxidoreductase
MTSQGALCEYVRVRADHVIPRPVNITPVQGAGVCLAGLSAWKLLFHDAKVTEGQRILIYNASGGVGSFAVQIAKATGCHVTATASVDSADFVKKLGADVVRPYISGSMKDLTVFLPDNRLQKGVSFTAVQKCLNRTLRRHHRLLWHG